MKAAIAMAIAARIAADLLTLLANVRKMPAPLARRQSADAASRKSDPIVVHSDMNQRNGVIDAPKPFISVYCSGGAAANVSNGCSMPRALPAWITIPATRTAKRPKYFEGLSV